MQAERYSALALGTGASGGGHGAGGGGGKLILLDDLPNIAHRGTRESFAAALARFVAVPARRSFPMVVVVTESFAAQQVLEDDGAQDHRRRRRQQQQQQQRADHAEVAVWSAADVLPGSVYNSSFCQTIRFNPVAPTIVAKGLRRILQIRSDEPPASARAPRLAPAAAATVKAIAD
ncbi:RFC checkpoint protein Rad17, partial [Coemansia javaensis]